MLALVPAPLALALVLPLVLALVLHLLRSLHFPTQIYQPGTPPLPGFRLHRHDER